MNRVILGSDHAGFFLKEELKKHLSLRGFSVTDTGSCSDENVDYPIFGAAVAKMVSGGEFERGILVCGSGVGMTIVANKYPNVRAVLCLDEETASLSRRHNDTNILVLGGRRTETERAIKILEIWLNTSFEGGRHQKRIDKIKEIENILCKSTNDS